MRSVVQIMAAEKRDMFFVQFGGSPFSHDRDHPSRQHHFDQFAANDPRWETAAPRGWLEGDPGVYATRFDDSDDSDDPPAARYAAEFRDGTGKSLEPDAYQTYLLPYAAWLQKRGTDAGEDGLDDDGEP